MAHPKGDFDYCSCHKVAGCWGESGFHFRMSGSAECFRRYPDRGDGGSACLKGLTREKCEEGGGCRYAGLPVAYEKCPRWADAKRRLLEERRRGEAISTAKKTFA